MDAAQQPRKRAKTMAATAETPLVTAVNYRWNQNNVFNAINDGRVPANKIFDRPHYYALLDKLPVSRGHCLLITKHNVATMFESMPPEAMADTMTDLQVQCTYSSSCQPHSACHRSCQVN